MPKDLMARAKALAKATAPAYRKAKKYVDLKNEHRNTVLSVLLTLDDEGRREYLNRFVKRSNSGGTVENGLLGFVPWLLNQADHWIRNPSQLGKEEGIAAIVLCLQEATDLDSSQLPLLPTDGPYFMLPSQLYRFPRNTEKPKTGLLSFDREYDGVDGSDERRDDGCEEDDGCEDDGCEDDGCEDDGCVDDEYEDQNQGEPLQVGSTFSKHDNPTDESDERRDDGCEQDDRCEDDGCDDNDYADQIQGEPLQVGSTLLALGTAIERIQGYASLDKVTMCRHVRQLLKKDARELAVTMLDLLDETQAAWWCSLLEGKGDFDSIEYQDWIKRHHFRQDDKHHDHAGLYMWTDINTGRRYGGQSADIRKRWEWQHWLQNQNQRFHRECVIKNGTAGVMMRGPGDPALRSLAEAVMNLALGLGQSGSGTSPQKQALKAAGVQLHHLAMNDAVGWEAVAKRKGVVKVVPSRFPTFYPPLLIGATSDAEAAARREEAANLGVTVARYRGPVSMLKTKSFTITSRSTRAGSYKYLELVGWGLAPIRITAKFMPKLWNLLPEDLNTRAKCHVEYEYVVSASTASPEQWIRTNWGSDQIRSNIVLYDLLIGRSFVEPVDCEDLKAYKVEVEAQGEKAEVEMLGTGYQIWSHQILGDWTEKISHHQLGPADREALVALIEKP